MIAASSMTVTVTASRMVDISAILNGADTPDQREFDAVAREQGLKAALDWRDTRYSVRA
jgi:hypothetical protein